MATMIVQLMDMEGRGRGLFFTTVRVKLAGRNKKLRKCQKSWSRLGFEFGKFFIRPVLLFRMAVLP